MKKYFNIANIALILAILVGDVFYIIPATSQFWIKCITSAGFFLLGALNLFYIFKAKAPEKKFGIIMLVGLFFAMLGDIILEIHFIAGALLFAVGHVFYFIAYCQLSPFHWHDLIASACIFVPATLLLTLAPFFDFGGVVMQLICILYALIISCMVGKAIVNFIKRKSLLTLIIMIGSILFFISDFVLVLNVFSNVSGSFWFMCLATYYPAECFLAYSLLLTDKQEALCKKDETETE